MESHLAVVVVTEKNFNFRGLREEFRSLYEELQGGGVLHKVLEAYIGGEKHPNTHSAVGTDTEAESVNFFERHDEALQIDPRSEKLTQVDIKQKNGQIYVGFRSEEKAAQ